MGNVETYIYEYLDQKDSAARTYDELLDHLVEEFGFEDKKQSEDKVREILVTKVCQIMFFEDLKS